MSNSKEGMFKMSRITNAMLTTNYLSDMQTNLKAMSTYQSQMSSGQKIQRSSDNPAIATQTLQLNSELAANKQYSSNITDSTNWLDTTDSALSEAGNVLKRVRELMVKAGNGTYGDDEISTIKDEVVSDVKQLGQLLNTSYDGSYIFGGTKSTSKAVTVDTDGTISYANKDGTAFSYTTSDGTVIKDNEGAKSKIAELDAIINSTDTSVTAVQKTAAQTEKTTVAKAVAPLTQIASDLTTEISDGVTTDYNVTATSLLEFNDSTLGSLNTMDVLSNIISNLGIASTATSTTTTSKNKSDALTALGGTDLNKLDAVLNNFTGTRASVGTKQNAMESAATTNDDQNYSMTSVLSSVADVDYTEASVNYSSAQTVYTAALQVSSKVLSKSLLDYL
jgi:flagellar hook-associated protein 3 FlgL